MLTTPKWTSPLAVPVLMLVVCAACSSEPGGDSEPNADETSRDDGARCSADADCDSGVCYPAPQWPGGHCTTPRCTADSDCQGDETVCVHLQQGDPFCARRCDLVEARDAPCRRHYACYPHQETETGWCGPVPSVLEGVSPQRLIDDNLAVQCQSTNNDRAQIDFDVATESDSYMIVPFTTDGSPLIPDRITRSSGPDIDLRGANRFQSFGARIFGVINPTIVPATPHHADQFETGRHTYVVETQAPRVCYYLLEDSADSTRLDLDVYLVGQPGSPPQTPERSHELDETFDHAEATLREAGITIGDIEYRRLPEDAVQDYRIVRNRFDIRELARQSSLDAHGDPLRANVFITEQFAFSDATSVLGMSLGIPGAAGLHGTRVSGVAMTGEFLGLTSATGTGNEFTGRILAHELGHFLGLFHTSETEGRGFDPLDDTPRCEEMTDPGNCPDWGNIMFPFAHWDNRHLTAGQARMLDVNPLTRP